MDANRITQDLKERFAAPLRDFYKRRIIFWHDEDREFETMLDELAIPGVTIIKLTGTNNFAVKKLLLHDDLTGNYLVYDPFSYAKPQDDWMRDIEHFSEEYRADYYSILMSELNIDPKPAMRKTVKLYADFFKNKLRTEKLKKIGRVYETPLQLHIDIMAVLAGLSGGTAQDVIIAVLEGGLDEENNSALNAIRQFGNIEAFWQLVHKYTGFIHSDEMPLGFLASHILLTALSQTMNPSVLKGLERFISESNKAYCYSIVHEWRNREDNSELFHLCRTVEQELKLPARFEKQEIETLLTGDIFPAIHETILKRFFTEVADQVVKVDLMLKTADNRRTSGWSERYTYYYDCLYYIAKMQEFYQANAGGFHIVEPKNIWKLYTDKAYEMDSFYRHFHFAFGSSLNDSNPLLEDSLKHAAEYVEGLYQNWFLKGLSDCWTNAVADDLTRIGYVSEIVKQRDFFRRYIKPTANNSRAFVIISDALRYEVAMELCDNITRTTRGSAKVEAVQSVFPSITKFGMASLLPGKELSVNDNMEVLVDGQRTNNTLEREKILRNSVENSIAVRHDTLLSMTTDQMRELTRGKDVIYIYHNWIDAIGDDLTTERKVFEACSDTIQELTNLVQSLINKGNATSIFITADHGFLYTYSPLAESDKLSKNAFSGNIYEAGRRYAIATPDTTADYLLPVQMDGEIAGTKVLGFTPRDTTRIKVTGGGENYVHGGISLQEMLVPVIVYKNLRASSKKYVEVSNAELKLLSESRKVSNLLFSLDFFQRQPIGEKIQPCAYTIYMTDDEGKVISDRQSVIADRTSTNASERVFRVRLNLKAGAYDKNKIYRLVIANDTDVPQEVEFHIDIAFADDFGFDL